MEGAQGGCDIDHRWGGLVRCLVFYDWRPDLQWGYRFWHLNEVVVAWQDGGTIAD